MAFGDIHEMLASAIVDTGDFIRAKDDEKKLLLISTSLVLEAKSAFDSYLRNDGKPIVSCESLDDPSTTVNSERCCNSRDDQESVGHGPNLRPTILDGHCISIK